MHTEQALLLKAEKKHQLNEEELVCLLEAEEWEEELAQAADRVRAAYVGDAVHLRGLIEFSSYCRQNCCYCGLRRDNRRAERFRLTEEQILALAHKAVAYGYHTVVLQSGEDAWFTVERLAPLLRAIKQTGLAITLSLGERSREEYKALREAGADRYLLRLETSDRELYERLDPGMSLANRLRCLRDLKELGYEVGTGSLVGLPGQTTASLAEDMLLYQELDADMLGIGPLIPHPDTPLAGVPAGNFHLTRRLISLLRLLLPEANIPATTAMETMVPGSRELILQSGANVVMPNVTEGEARRKYALYPGKACVSDTPGQCKNCLEFRITRIGRTIGTDAGWRKHHGTDKKQVQS